MEETRTDFAYAHGIHAYLSAVPIGTADGCACYILYQAGWAQPQPAGQQRRDSQTVGWGAWTAGSRAGRRHSPAQNRAGPTGQAGRSWGVSMFPVFRGGGAAGRAVGTTGTPGTLRGGESPIFPPVKIEFFSAFRYRRIRCKYFAALKCASKSSEAPMMHTLA